MIINNSNYIITKKDKHIPTAPVCSIDCNIVCKCKQHIVISLIVM